MGGAKIKKPGTEKVLVGTRLYRLFLIVPYRILPIYLVCLLATDETRKLVFLSAAILAL